jgi:hypothetical protein
MPFGSEIATAVTIVLVGVIITGYVSVLKRNGWIGKSYAEKGLKNNFLQSQPESKTQNPPNSFIETKAAAPKPENKEPLTPQTDAPANKPEENKTPQRKNSKKDEPQKDKPAGCKNHFGYLWTLPKGITIPDECYCCTKLIECTKK